MTSLRRLLVTGASGFVGRQILAQLSPSEWDIHAVRRSSEPSVGDTRVQWHAHDLREPRTAEQLVEAVQPSHVLSLAWNAEPGAYWTAPDNDAWADATIALAGAAARCGGRRFVGAGTCAEYDWAAIEGPCDEFTTPRRPHTIYGRAKLRAAEGIAAVGRESGLSTAWGRVFFLYGPGEDSQRLVPSVSRALRSGERVKVSEGRQIRDFLHVSDAARAFIALITGEETGAVNVASGVGITVRRLVETLARQADRESAVDFGAVPMQSDEPPAIVANVSRLHATGWRQQVRLEAGLEECLRSTDEA